MLSYSLESNKLYYGNGVIAVELTIGGLWGINGDDIEHLNDGSVIIKSLVFRTDQAKPAHREGQMFYDNTIHAFSCYNEASEVTENINRELLIRVYNNSGNMITNGTVLAPLSVFNGFPTVQLANARAKDKCRLVAVATMDIPNNSYGYVTKFGNVSDIDTSMFTSNELLYLSDTNSGMITNIRPTDGSYPVIIGVVSNVGVNGSIIVDIIVGDNTVEVNDTNGFPLVQKTNTNISVVDATRTFTISATQYPFHYYINGEKYEQSTAQSVIFSDVEGQHFVYFDTEGLKVIANPTPAQIEEMVLNYTFVAIIPWNATDKKVEIDILDERHGIGMNPATHLYLHLTQGAKFISGFGLSNFVIGDGSLDSHAQFSVADGIYFDEDIEHSSSLINATTSVPVVYNLGVNKFIRSAIQPNNKVLAASGGRLYYNSFIGSVWGLTECSDNRYVLAHEFGFNGNTVKVVTIMGQNEYATLTLAREGANVEINNIVSSLPFVEMIPLSTTIYQTRSSYTNSLNARIVQVSTGVNYVDWRTSKTVAGGGGVTSHSNLTDVLQAGTGILQGHISDQAQTIAGEKTFTNNVKVVYPQVDADATNKAYVDSNWSQYFGTYTRLSTTQINILNVDVTKWKGKAVRFNDSVYCLITAATFSTNTTLTIEGKSIPTTITKLEVSKINPTTMNSLYWYGTLNNITEDLLAYPYNESYMVYSGSKAHVLRTRVYCNDLGTNSSGGTWNVKVGTSDLISSNIALQSTILTSGTLVIGEKYKIITNTGMTVTNVGAADNNVGTIFTATGTTPTAWGTGSLALYTKVYSTSGILIQNDTISDNTFFKWCVRIATGSDNVRSGYVEITIIEE